MKILGQEYCSMTHLFYRTKKQFVAEIIVYQYHSVIQGIEQFDVKILSIY